MTTVLPRCTVEDLLARRGPAVDDEALAVVGPIVREVRAGGLAALRRLAERLDGLAAGDPLVYPREALEASWLAVRPETRERLGRVAGRIRSFAEAQRAALRELTLAVPGGEAGHRLAPVEGVGCYAPGGRFPLPSSVLMTAVTARVAGVERVWVASPRPAPETLAAAWIAGADGLLAAGGAQAVAALAWGAGPVPAADLVCGPGNRYVTAAKWLVSRDVRIDMLAGPSELVVLADDSASPALVAADLLAQAEHDPEALPVLVTTSASLAGQVEAALRERSTSLPTREVAVRALQRGGVVLVESLDQAVTVCDRIAPEHLEVMTRDPERVAGTLRHWGGLFVGAGAAEVLGDYGIGPNHVLPTGGTARQGGGLSVATFLRIRTWLRMDRLAEAADPLDDAVWLGRVEGLEAHARSAAARQR